MLYLNFARLRSLSGNIKIKHPVVFVLCEVWLEDELNKFQTCSHILSRSNSHVNKQLCQQQLHTVRRRGWEGSADTEVVCCGNGEARKEDKGKEVALRRV